MDTDTFPGQLHIQPLLQYNARNDQAVDPDILLPRLHHTHLPTSRPSDHNFHCIMDANHHRCFGA